MQTWLSLQCFCSLVSHACLSAYELEWKAWGSCLHPRRCEILRDWSQELLIEKLKHAFSCGFCHCAWENLEPCTEVWCGGWRSHLEKWRHYWEWFWGFWYPEILCGIMISYFVSAETMHVMGISISSISWWRITLVLVAACFLLFFTSFRISSHVARLICSLNQSEFYHFVRFFVEVTEAHSDLIM